MKLFSYVVFLLFVIVGCESLDEVIENNYTTNIITTNIITTNIINGILLDNITNVADDSTLELDGAFGLTTIEIGSANYLFVAGAADDGISVFSVGSDGSLDNITNVRDDSILELFIVSGLTTLEIGSVNYLFVSGSFDDGISVFSVGSDGSLDNITNVANDSDLQLAGASGLTTLEIGDSNYLFVTGAGDSGISVFSVGSGGSLDNITNVSDDSNLQLDGASGLTTLEIGDSNYLFVSGAGDDGISVFSVGSDGSLDNITNVSDDSTLLLDGARYMTTLEIGDINYLFVAGASDDGISVFSVGSDGSLDNITSVSDDSDLQLDNIGGLTTLGICDSNYLFVAGLDDNGISVFSVGSDGSLDNITNVEDDSTLELAGARGLTTLEIGDSNYLFVAGASDDGISVFSVK